MELKMIDIKKILVFIGTGALVSTSSMAVVSVDGKLDSLSDWDHTFNVAFNFEQGKSGTGFLALGKSASGNNVLYYSVPKQFVDVSYGDTAIGWQDSRPWSHSYGDLTGSDKLEFAINQNYGVGNGGLDIEVEFNGKVVADNSVIASSATSLEYNLKVDGFNETKSPELTGGTNADYTDDSDANYLNATNTDWIFDVAYEIEFTAETFNQDAWDNGTLENLFVATDYENHKKVNVTCDENASSWNADASHSGTCAIEKKGKKDHKGNKDNKHKKYKKDDDEHDKDDDEHDKDDDEHDDDGDHKYYEHYNKGYKYYDEDEDDNHGIRPTFNAFFGGHASPSKLAILSVDTPEACEGTGSGTKCVPSNTSTNDVPLPGTIWLMLVGLAGLYRNRMIKKTS